MFWHTRLGASCPMSSLGQLELDQDDQVGDQQPDEPEGRGEGQRESGKGADRSVSV